MEALGDEAELFKGVDKLRGNMEPSDSKPIDTLGTTFGLVWGERRFED